MSHKRGREMPAGVPHLPRQSPPWTHQCPCGKRAYPVRAAAKRVAKRLNSGAGVYRCRVVAGDDRPFHVGHLPRNVVKGKISRGEIYNRE